MLTPSRRAAPLPFLVCALLSAPAPCAADWPAHRHDARRTARGDRGSRIDEPAPSFRTYLGGSLGREQYVAYDVDGSGRAEVVFVMGGALRAKTPDDAVVWETEALDIYRIDGLWDLDADGTPEVVASARAGRVHVIRVTDGAVLWTLPAGVVGNVGNVRFADFDGDGAVDLYLADAACGSTGSLGDVARAYSFASDLASPTELFALERGVRDYVCGQRDTIADVDGDGALEVVAQGRFHFYVYSTADGSLESESEDVGSIPYGRATTRLADVDADGRPEIVAYTNNDYAPPVNSRRVFLMDWDETEARLVKRWEVSVTDLRDDRHGFGPGGLADADGDGDFDVVTSFYTASTASWRTVALDAATGAEIDDVPVGPFRGLLDLTGDGRPEILAGDREVGLSAFALTATGFERLFTAPGVEPVYVRVPPEARRETRRVVPLGRDLDGDGDAELVALRYGAARAEALVALASGEDPPAEQASLAIDPDVSLSTFEVFSNVTLDGPQIATARSDGYLWVLDSMLRPTNVDTGGEIPQRGLRIGGYYSGARGIGLAPLAADLNGDGAEDIVVRDSRGVYRRIEPAGASLVEPPAVGWEVAAARALIVDADGDGARELAVIEDSEPPAVRLLNGADATMRWRREVGSATTVPTIDLTAGDVSGDGVADLVFELRDRSGGEVVMNALSGVDGAPVWATDYRLVVAGSGLGGNALFDLDGDGRLDVLAAPRNRLEWLSGVDGSTVASADGGYPEVGALVDVVGDATPEVLTAGSVRGVQAYPLDLSAPLWASGTTAPDRTLHNAVVGAAVSCPAGPRFVQGHNSSPRLTAWDATTGAVVDDVALRAGARHEPPSAAPDGPGTLGNVTVSPDLTGDGTPGILVPSTDGFLYALDPCDLSLTWALDFRFPVGEAILADTDGDGEDEIVVTVADGFLYGVDRQVIEAPLFVVENDGTGPASGPGDDIDELVTTSTLHANWASVEGATSYEYAVITPGGAFVTRPNFINAGDTTSVTVTDLPLTAGRRYLFAVRAIGADGASRETLSDGVLVLPDPCAACAEGEVCEDGACVPDPCFGIECAPGTVCRAGTCVGAPADGGVAPTDGGVAADGGGGVEAEGGCCSVAPGASDRTPRGLLLLSALAALALLGRRRRSARR